MIVAGFEVPLDAASKPLVGRMVSALLRVQEALVVGDETGIAVAAHGVENAAASLVGYGLLRGRKLQTERA